jgi:hypothetical protein
VLLHGNHVDSFHSNLSFKADGFVAVGPLLTTRADIRIGVTRIFHGQPAAPTNNWLHKSPRSSVPHPIETPTG